MKSVKQIMLLNLSVSIVDFFLYTNNFKQISYVIEYTWISHFAILLVRRGFLMSVLEKQLLHNYLEAHDFERLILNVVFSLCVCFTEWLILKI